MLVLNADITIGSKRFRAVHAVTVKRSIYSLGATATIKVPVTAVLRSTTAPPTRMDTAQVVKVGDPVEVRLGYNGRYYTEFRGYVRAVNLKTPLEIECEDEFYNTRTRSVKLSGTTTLKALLGKLGLDVAYAEDLTLKNFVVPDKPVSAVLAKIKKDYGLSIFFGLDGKMYACRPEKVIGDRVNYQLRGNVINDDDLQFLKKEDIKLCIKAICFQKDGTKVEATKGDKDGAQRTLYFYDVGSAAELATLAQRELERYKYDGYNGSITTFLEPYAAPAMVARLVDPVYPERSGQYYIESVETTYGSGGGRRKVELGTMVE